MPDVPDYVSDAPPEVKKIIDGLAETAAEALFNTLLESWQFRPEVLETRQLAAAVFAIAEQKCLNWKVPHDRN